MNNWSFWKHKSLLIFFDFIDYRKSLNTTLVLLYWKVGKRINEDILNNKRAEYGKKIIISLTKELTPSRR
jgi:hypothetical protein